MPFPNEHAARLHAPGLYDRFRRENDKFGSGIDAIFGHRKTTGKMELQAIRFDASKFTTAQARKWLKDHDYKPILFEPASKSKSMDAEDMKAGAPRSGRPAKGDEDMPATLTEELTTDAENKTYSKHAQYRRALDGAKAFLACKAENPSAPGGGLGGYASVWDVIDRSGEVVRKGAFTKSIQERAAAGKIPLMVRHYAHGGDVVDAVGVVNTLTEDNYGLKFDATWCADEHSQKIRKKCTELFNKGVKLSASIGYRVINFSIIKTEGGKTVVELNELAIGEITVTLKPVNASASITSAKSEDGTPVLVKLFDKINEADAKASFEERSKVVTDSLGISVDEAKSLCESLRGSITKTLALLEPETGSTGAAGGASTRKDPKASAASGKTANGAAPDASADLHSARLAMESMRMTKMRLEAGQKL